MMKARIYKPSQTATQSGHAKTDAWVLEYESQSYKAAEPLMGWTQSDDTLNQVKLKFETMDSAKNFAEDKGLEYTILPPHARRVKPRNYGDNFRYTPPEENK